MVSHITLHARERDQMIRLFFLVGEMMKLHHILRFVYSINRTYDDRVFKFWLSHSFCDCWSTNSFQKHPQNAKSTLKCTRSNQRHVDYDKNISKSKTMRQYLAFDYFFQVIQIKTFFLNDLNQILDVWTFNDSDWSVLFNEIFFYFFNHNWKQKAVLVKWFNQKSVDFATIQ